MSFGQFISILRARWVVALVLLGITASVTLVVSLLLPKQYAAVATVVMDSKPDPVAAFNTGALLLPSVIATQVDVIESDRVALRVVRDLKLADNPQIRDQWKEETKGQGSVELWLADSLKKKLEVKPSRESNVINVTYKSPDPKFAAGLANAFVRAYLSTTVELRVDPARQYSSFFENRAKEAREALEKAQTNLSAFQREKGIIANDERLDVENARLNELSSQVVGLQAITAESSSRQTQAQGSSADKLQEVLGSQIVGGLKLDLTRAEARLQELSAKLGDSHPQIVELKANIAETRQRMDAETKKITGGVTVSANINRQREGEIKNALEAQRVKVLRLKEVRDEGAVLTREVESAQRSYDAVLARLNQSSLESQATQSNISVLSEATPPMEPAGPKVVLNTILSIVLGTFLGIAAALVLELMDRRVRSPEDLSESLGVPVLGALPKPMAKRNLALRSSMQQRLLTGGGAAPAAGVQ
nr:chain length determinant protein EpsF [uncultured Roseateles sp.]